MERSRGKLVQFLMIILAILITVSLLIDWSTEPISEESISETPISEEGVTKVPITPNLPSDIDPLATTLAEPFNVQLTWFYKPPANGDLHTLSQHFDFFILTHKDEKERDQLRSLGVGSPILQYLLLTEIRDPGNCTDRPFGNQVAFRPGDFCMISAEHPDWFLLDEHGTRIGGQVGFMDPGNPGFRKFWLDRVQELQEQYGWNDIFIDNVDAGLGRFRALNALPQKYKTNEEYQAAVKGFLEFLRANYSIPSGRKMYANIAVVTDYEVWKGYLDVLDGAMVENFAAGWRGRDKSRAEWEEQMNALEEAHKRGKTTLLVAQGEEDDLKRQEFSFASYLLIANEFAFFRYAPLYDQIQLYENYSINLGPAISSRYREGAIWRRDFLHGYVIVNPDTVEAEIIIK